MGCPAPPCTGISPTMLLPESAGLALGFATMPHALAHTDTVAGYDAYAAEVGDDNENGIIEEDESGWNCTPTPQPNLWCRQRTGSHPRRLDDHGRRRQPRRTARIRTLRMGWEDYVGGYN